MARKVSDLIDRVRQVLQDQDQSSYRYPTSDIVGYLNDAVTEAKRLRPDLFIRSYRDDPPLVSDDPSTDYTAVRFPLPDSCFTAVVGYVVAWCEVRDDEFAVDGRAATFMNSFTQKLIGAA